MKITKYLHSCLLIEEAGQTVIIDPGSFSHQAKILDIDKIQALDGILISHSHVDHFSSEFVRALTDKFPQVKVIAPADVLAALKLSAPENFNFVNSYSAQHEALPGGSQPPDNLAFDLFDKLTHPGDSLSLKSTKPILALPVQAPWGSLKWALDTAIALKPQKVIPIHDWHWHKEARRMLYDMAGNVLEKNGIEFIKPIDGVSFSI